MEERESCLILKQVCDWENDKIGTEKERER